MTTAATTTSPDTNTMLTAVAGRIRSGSRFLITGHRNPDGDAIGSALALQGFIRKLGKEARIVVRDPFHRSLHYLPGAAEIEISETLPAGYPESYDALFTMECPEQERAGYPILPGPVVNVDHHLGNTMYGEINYLDLEAPSVGEMILQLNRLLQLPLDRDIATAIYVSLATDTGFFRYSNTTIRAFDAAATLVRAGANPGEISLWINESASAGSIRLLALCLNTLQLHDDDQIATIALTNDFFRRAGASAEDSEGIVNYGRTIDSVRVSALFKESSDGTRVSMRAKPGVDVQAIAARFGGGGHKAAAGCLVPKPIDDARALLLPLLREAIRGA